MKVWICSARVPTAWVLFRWGYRKSSGNRISEWNSICIIYLLQRIFSVDHHTDLFPVPPSILVCSFPPSYLQNARWNGDWPGQNHTTIILCNAEDEGNDQTVRREAEFSHHRCVNSGGLYFDSPHTVHMTWERMSNLPCVHTEKIGAWRGDWASWYSAARCSTIIDVSRPSNGLSSINFIIS